MGGEDGIRRLRSWTPSDYEDGDIINRTKEKKIIKRIIKPCMK